MTFAKVMVPSFGYSCLVHLVLLIWEGHWKGPMLCGVAQCKGGLVHSVATVVSEVQWCGLAICSAAELQHREAAHLSLVDLMVGMKLDVQSVFW